MQTWFGVENKVGFCIVTCKVVGLGKPPYRPVCLLHPRPFPEARRPGSVPSPSRSSRRPCMIQRWPNTSFGGRWWTQGTAKGSAHLKKNHTIFRVHKFRFCGETHVLNFIDRHSDSKKIFGNTNKQIVFTFFEILQIECKINLQIYQLIEWQTFIGS